MLFSERLFFMNPCIIGAFTFLAFRTEVLLSLVFYIDSPFELLKYLNSSKLR